MIRILIVDDSLTETLLLQKLFEDEPDLLVVGCASNGKEAVALNNSLQPDLITMDIEMPVMDGVEATQLIMMQRPTPIVVISSKVQDATLNATFKALTAGAISVLEKPGNMLAADFAPQRQVILDTIRTMAQVKTIKKRFYKPCPQTLTPTPPVPRLDGTYEVVALGASVGGPQVLKNVLSKLPKNFPSPILVVQHMTAGFIEGFAHWLNESVELTAKIAQDKEPLLPGFVYFAPDHCHLTVARDVDHLTVKLVYTAPVAGFCPSITMLYHSLANVCGEKSIGILLTGMGNDGAAGLLEMHHAHAHTIIQDPDSAVVFGMAGVAQSLGAVDKVVALDKIATYLMDLYTHHA